MMIAIPDLNRHIQQQPAGADNTKALTNLPVLLTLVRRIQENMATYLDYGWIMRCAHSGQYSEMFEEFDTDLRYWLQAVTAEVTILTEQGVSDIKQDMASINKEVTSLRQLLESDADRRKQYARDAGTDSACESCI